MPQGGDNSSLVTSHGNREGAADLLHFPWRHAADVTPKAGKRSMQAGTQERGGAETLMSYGPLPGATGAVTITSPRGPRSSPLRSTRCSDMRVVPGGAFTVC